MALIVTDPREEEAPWIVIVAPCHFTSLMQTLQSRPSKGTTFVSLSFLPQALSSTKQQPNPGCCSCPISWYKPLALCTRLSCKAVDSHMLPELVCLNWSMPKQGWIAVKVPTIQRAEALVSLVPKSATNTQALNKMHRVCVQDRVLTAPTVPSAVLCAGQEPPGIRHAQPRAQDCTEMLRCLPSLTARGMSEVSSAAAGKQIPLCYF